MSEDEKKGWMMVGAFFVCLIVGIIIAIKVYGHKLPDHIEGAPADQRVNINGDQRKELKDMDNN